MNAPQPSGSLPAAAASSISERLLSRMAAFLAGGGFAAFVIVALLFYQAFLAVMTFAPINAGAWGAFVEEFRIRCFQYDPQTGGMRWSAAWTMLSEPLLLQVIVFLIWRGALRELWRTRRRALAPIAATALMTVTLAVACLKLFSQPAPQATANLPFPADTLRTQLPMPAFTLTDQDGRAVSVADYRGKVVLVTAAYTTCTKTCPLLLLQVRQVLEKLSPAEQAELAVITISLNPEEDTRERRALTLQTYCGARPTNVHFVSGQPAAVNDLLDQLGVMRVRDPQTGQLEHANLFFVLDRQGRIAYRLSLSERHAAWLLDALRTLLAEKST